MSLTDVMDDEVEKSMVAPEERVFQRFGLDCEEIQFSILVSMQARDIDLSAHLRSAVAGLRIHLLDCFYSYPSQ